MFCRHFVFSLQPTSERSCFLSHFFDLKLLNFKFLIFQCFAGLFCWFVTWFTNVLCHKNTNNCIFVTNVTILLNVVNSTFPAIFEKKFFFARFYIIFLAENAWNPYFSTKYFFCDCLKTCRKRCFSTNLVIFSTCEH